MSRPENPPVNDPEPSGSSQPRLNAQERTQRIQFRRALSLMAMTVVLPGSAQFTTGNRRVGLLAMTVWVLGWLALIGAALLAATSPAKLLKLGTSPDLLFAMQAILVVLAIGWAALFIDAWRLGHPLELQRQHRLAVVLLNGGMAVVVLAVLLYGAHIVRVTHDTISSISVSNVTSDAVGGRYNVLLIGGDAGDGRWGLRPDSMTVASIDAETGKTVLVSLPRNMQNFTFQPGSTMAKQFPDGYKDCGDGGCYLNGISTWANDHPDLFKSKKYPGIEATIQAVEGVTDLEINYWVMVNLDGFKGLVDAVGGVTLNVRDRIPVGGLGSDVTGYIEPGVKKLNGHDTLWFARAREGSDDYSRMARQKCVMSAMLTQLSPQTVVTNFEDIAAAGSSMVHTSIPAGEIGAFADLANRAKNTNIATVSLVPPAINTANPDMKKVHKMVRNAIDRSEGKKAKKGLKATKKVEKTQKETGSVTGGSLGSRNDGYVANQSDNLADAC